MTHLILRPRKSREEVIENAARTAALVAANQLLDTLSLAKTTDLPATTHKTLLRIAAEKAADLNDFTALLGFGDARSFLELEAEQNDPDYAPVLDQALALVEGGGAAVITNDEA
ncbi:MAG: hypothetical protein RBR34_10715 [Rhodospirillaceae bacterium]|nr:hypothetical protein [Rhodospirillaceae bacterium]